MVEEDFKKQFQRLYDYVVALSKTNEGSTVKLMDEGPQVTDVELQQTTNHPPMAFKIMYTCLKACKESFLKSRPLIRLDG